MKHPAWVLLCALTACSPIHHQRAGTTALRPDDPIARIENRLLPAVLVKGEPRGVTLAARMREHHIPGLSIAVFNNYRIEWARAYGFADVESGTRATTETLFQAGSISKPVSAMAALMAVAKGALALDAPINDALTSWKLPDNELTRAAPVTLRRILSHTAGTTVHGFAGYAAGTPLPTVPQLLDGTPPATSEAVRVDLAPGTKFRYSGGGVTIMQQALVDRLGQPFPVILHDSVLAPFGMSHSTYDQPLPAARVGGAAAGYGFDGTVIEGKRNVYPEMAAAGLWTTPSDLARFFLEIQLARAGRSTHLSRAIATEMTTRVVDVGPANYVGLGLFMSSADHTFGHNGADAGFQALATASLDHGYGVVIMANSDNGLEIFDEIARTVAAEYGWEKQPETIVRAALPPARLAQLPGRFASDGQQPFTLAVDGTRIELRRPFLDAVELVPIEGNVLVNVEDGVRLTVDEAAQQVSATFPGGRVRQATRLADDVHLPILELDAGHYDVALRGYLELQRATPQSPALDEELLNWLGVERLSRKDYAKAIALFRVNVALYPDSMNTYDSLGEGYAQSGDTAKAIATFEAGLQAMARDHKSPLQVKEQLCRNAEKRLATLRAGRPR